MSMSRSILSCRDLSSSSLWPQHGLVRSWVERFASCASARTLAWDPPDFISCTCYKESTERGRRESEQSTATVLNFAEKTRNGAAVTVIWIWSCSIIVKSTFMNVVVKSYPNPCTARIAVDWATTTKAHHNRQTTSTNFHEKSLFVLYHSYLCDQNTFNYCTW